MNVKRKMYSIEFKICVVMCNAIRVYLFMLNILVLWCKLRSLKFPSQNISICYFKKLLTKVKGDMLKENNAKNRTQTYFFVDICKIRSNKNSIGLHMEVEKVKLGDLNP